MYKLSKKLDEAICALFEEPEIGYSALGCEPDLFVKDLDLRREKDLPISLAPLERVALLRRRLEDWVELKGLEIEEFEGEVDTVRIQSDALTTLLVLRDLAQFFPEVETASKEEYESVSSKL